MPGKKCLFSTDKELLNIVPFIKTSEVDPGFLERGFICIKVWGFALLILSHFA